MGNGQSIFESFFHRRSENFENKNDLNVQNIDDPEASQTNGIQPGHEFIEMETVAQNSSLLSVKIKTCSNKDDFIAFFDMPDESADDESSLVNKFQFVDILPEINTTDLQNIHTKCRGKSKVLLLMSENEEKFSIYWKSKEIDEFLELKHTKKLDWEWDRSLSEYVAEFLAKSLNNDHLGLVSEFTFHPGSKPIDIDLLADSRDFNLLLLAAEKGNTEIVEILITLNMSKSSMDSKVDAQSLAIKGQHFDVTYALLQNNLMFPKDFDASKCTGRLKEFCEVTEEVHRLIIANNKEKLEEILNQHKNLRHFYNFSNKSALRVAIENKSFDAFDLLLSKNLRFGSNENPAEYYEEIDTDSKRTLRDIQYKYSQSFLEKHIHTLLSKSTACFDETEAKDKLGNVQRAFELLSENPFIKIILKIVAASKNFKIVFDFNREAVNVVDPTTTKFTQGIFYLSGKIFIGAKQLLDPGTVNETLAVLAHELCHFAMNLVYKNHAKPYKSQDRKTMEEFEQVLKDCEAESEAEEVIGSVFDCYPTEAHHAELIVRVVHLLALYRDMPEIITEERRIFSELFEFYENKVVPELEQALSELEGRHEKELKIKDKKISNFKKISIIGGILAVIGIVCAIVIPLVIYTPTYRFDDLSIKDRMSVLGAPIRYKGVNLEFCDLFPENSTIYKNLTSEHISQIFKEQVLDFSDPHFHYIEQQVSHKWKNMAEELKQKVLASNFTFQNDSLMFKKLHEINSEVFGYLSSEQIIEVLNGKMLVVYEMIKNETKFYVERKFLNENVCEIFGEFLKSLNEELFYNNFDPYNWSQTNKTFKKFYLEFTSQNFFTKLNKINEIRQNSEYKKCTLPDFEIKGSGMIGEDSDTILSHKFNFTQVFNIANDTKLFILSAEAGTGKTVTFEQFTMRIKKEFPTRWVSYIDLKDYKHLYKGTKTLQDVRNMLETIFNLSSENEFEKKIFEDFFDSGNLILLWNGFDEISPDFSEDVIRILGLIKNRTGNIQFICTRPLYAEQLSVALLVDVYILVPLDKEDQENFVKRFFIGENVEPEKIANYLEKVQKIVRSTNSEEPFETPLMLGMIAELIVNDVELYESENLFEIYQKFVRKKFEIWKSKSEFGKKFVDNSITKYSQFNMMMLYQSYALKSELHDDKFTYFYAPKLKAMRQMVPKELTNDEISRMGILYINGPRNIKFAHRTFAEFFVAQYFIENVYNANDEPSDVEAELRIIIFKKVFEFSLIQKFIESFINSKNSNELKPFDAQISKVLTAKFQKTLFCNINIFHLLDFFKKDSKVLKILLQIDENQTLYTSFFSYMRIYDINPHDLKKNYVRPYLTDDEFERFLRGKDQKGVILLNENINNKRIWPHDYYKRDDELKTNRNSYYVFESIEKNLTNSELKELLMSEIILYNINQKIIKRYKIIKQYAMYIEKVWNLTESRLTKSDQKEVLRRSLDPSNFIYFIYLDIKEFILSKFDKLFSNDEIYENFKNNNILDNVDNFDSLWIFVVNHTNREQQKALLNQTKSCKMKICRPIGLLFNQPYKVDEFVQKQLIYENYFNETELQDYILSHSSDAFLYILLESKDWKFQRIIEFLKKTFRNKRNSLKEFLMRKIEPTGLNIFEILSNYGDPNGNLKALSLFLES